MKCDKDADKMCPTNAALEIVEEYVQVEIDGIKSDTSGSYTGVSKDGDTPVQDADDL